MLIKPQHGRTPVEVGEYAQSPGSAAIVGDDKGNLIIVLWRNSRMGMVFMFLHLPMEVLAGQILSSFFSRRMINPSFLIFNCI